MKKVLVVETSLRAGSNTDILAEEFARGVRDGGNEAEIISLKGKRLEFCRGCLACIATGKCVVKDDVAEIAEKVKAADVVVFATPIYYYEMCGQMKTLLDRLNPLYESEYAFREIYLLTAAAEQEAWAMDRTVAGLGGWIECFPKCELKGVLKGLGLEGAGEVKARADYRQQAYEMGKNV